MLKLSTLVATAAMSLICAVAPTFGAPTDVTIGSGGKTGTYYPVIEEIKRFCDPGLVITVNHYVDPVTGDTGGGSVVNLRRILDNLATAGLVQTDVAYLEKSANPAMARILALLPLHTEQIHVIVPSIVSVMTKEAEGASLTNWGGSPAVFEDRPTPLTTISDLNGKRVAAWGGSVTTAKVIDQLGNVQMAEIIDAGKVETAFTMLDAGEVDAILAVTGAPTQWVTALAKGKYKLLVAGSNLEDAVSDVYGTSGISYDNMGTTGQQLSALSVDALLMTRTYKTESMVNALAALQQCVKDKIFEIQDTPGTHPAWQTIDPTREMKWDNIFEAPAETRPALPTS